MELLADGVPWFPQQWAGVFFVVLSLLSLFGTVALLYHMNVEWEAAMTLGRRLRYLTLLATGIVITGSAVEQAQQAVFVNYRNFGGMLLAVMLVVTAAVSIAEHRRRTR